MARPPFAVLAALLLLAACPELPQPFRHEGLNPKAVPRATRGVAVRPPDGPFGIALAEGVARLLGEADVPATLRELPGTPVLAGEVLAQEGRVAIHWALLGADGTATPLHTQTIPAARWAEAGSSPRAVRAIAAQAADALAPALRGDDAGPAANAPRVRVSVPGNLRGDGERALARAMKRALEGNGLVVAEGDADYIVTGRVTVLPVAGGENLGVAWTVAGRDGHELGTAAQAGDVPPGRLDGPWGSLAYEIAAGGAEGVAAIVRSATAK